MVALRCNLTSAKRNAAVFRCGIYGAVCDAVHSVLNMACIIHITNVQCTINRRIAPIVGAYCIRPELRGFAMLLWWVALRCGLCGGVQGVCNTPLHIYHIQSKDNIHRSYNFRKTQICCHFQNASKTTWDIGKTMSYVEKIISDIIETTSDLFSTFANI